MDNLHLAEHFEEWRNEFERKMNAVMLLRNNCIRDSFNDGFSQKEIASAVGLSESTIKHIIAKLKKEQ